MQIVNFRKFSCSTAALDRQFAGSWVYIGRKSFHCSLEASPLANPFRLDGCKRGSTYPRYRQWLWTRLQEPDSPQLAALKSLTEEAILVCWCQQPRPCHGHVVKAAWEWLASADLSF